MVRIEDRMAELEGGFVRLELKDKTEWNLKPLELHKRELLFNYKKVQEQTQRYEEAVKKNHMTSEFIELHDERSKLLHNEQNEIVRKILKNSYSQFDTEKIDSLMINYDTELLSEMYMFFGWIDKEVMVALQKQRIEELKKLSGEENPENKLKKNEQEKSEEISSDNKSPKKE